MADCLELRMSSTRYLDGSGKRGRGCWNGGADALMDLVRCRTATNSDRGAMNLTIIPNRLVWVFVGVSLLAYRKVS